MRGPVDPADDSWHFKVTHDELVFFAVLFTAVAAFLLR